MNDEPTVDVEAIMQEIRAEILAQRAGGPGADPIVATSGERFSPAFYEHLYQAGLVYDQLKPDLFVSRSRIPLIGPLLERMRQKIHELVLFYVNQVAADQIRMNTHLLRALSVLAEDLEQEREANDEAR
jgi:hypothetical protein